MNNLAQNYNISEFYFPFAFSYLTAPLSLIQQQFHNFMVNTVYFAIPNFRSFKSEVMTPIIDRSFDKSLPFIIICMTIIAFLVFFVSLMMVVNYRVTKVKHYMHDFMQKLGEKIVSEKRERCLLFYNNYAFMSDQESIEEETIIITNPYNSKEGLNLNVSKMISENTERELDLKDMFKQQSTPNSSTLQSSGSRVAKDKND